MKMRFLNLFACMGAMAALCTHSTKAEAIFASVKSTGMAATCISYPLDSVVGAYNPAGMTEVGDRLDIEAGWVHDKGSTTVLNNTVPPGTRTPTGALVPPGTPNSLVNGHYNGMKNENVYPVGFGLNKTWWLCDEWELATGIVLYNRNYQKTTYTKPVLLLGTSKPGLEYLNETLSPVVAIKWCNTHSFGISANYQVERLKVNGLENFARAVRPPLPGGSLYPENVTNKGYGYSTGWGVTFGYLGHITDELSIGVTYQPETSMSRISKYKGFLAQKGKLNIPRKIGAGISYKILPCWVVAFDVEQIQWSKIKALHNNLLDDNGVLQPLGSSNGPGFGFRDQWYYRFGTEWAVSECWTVRAGYRFAEMPFKKSQAPVNLLTLDTVESFLTLGATWNVNECNEVSFLFAYGFEHKVKGDNTIPSFLGGGDVHLKEEKFALGLAWGWKY